MSTSTSTSTTSSPPTAEATAGGEERSIAELRKVTGAVTSTTTKRSGAGAKGALAGLGAVEPKPVSKGFFKTAVVAALLGIGLLQGTTAMAQTTSSRSMTAKSVTVERVIPPPTGPPLPRSGLQVQVESLMAKGGTIGLGNGVEKSIPADTALGARIEDNKPTPPPQLLATLANGMTVIQGSDPGDFYCEHAFFTSTREARTAGTSILTNRLGEVMTGFLHNPSDDFTYDASKTPVQAERHADRREIVGAAIRGFYEEARTRLAPDAPFQMLLTGYAQWGGVVNNPTGDFVVHQENVDAAMQRAFGDALATRTGKVLQQSADGERTRLEYRITDATTGRARTIVVEAVRLPVSDEAINGGPQSLQARIRDFQPHAVMSMGVAGGSSAYQAEFHADDGGLDLTAGAIRHDDGKAPQINQPDNHSLGRAIRLGTQIIATPVAGGV
jgi:hypothetical protein